jgi:hypothetical protein
MKMIILLTFFSSWISMVQMYEPCGRAGLAGPQCQYPTCGANGILNGDGSACVCANGFTGARCTTCSPTQMYNGETRDHVCCPFGASEGEVPSQWWLLAPKASDAYRFLSGMYTSVGCLRPESPFYQNETAEYFLDCGCKISLLADRKRKLAEEAEAASLAEEPFLLRKRFNPHDQEVFWREQVTLNQQRLASFYINPATIADMIVAEHALLRFNASNAAAAMAASAATLHATTTTTSTNDLSSGGALTIMVLVFELCIVVLGIIFVIYLCTSYPKELASFTASKKTSKSLIRKILKVALSMSSRKKSKHHHDK